MRLVAFTLLGYAAFDGWTWHVDRAGVALLGLAFAALSIGRFAPKPRARPFGVPKGPAMLDRNGRIDLSQLDPLPPMGVRTPDDDDDTAQTLGVYGP